MAGRTDQFHRADRVAVKTADEILRTLDADGAVDHLPFMPEMLEYCGKRLQVSKRASMVCFSGPGSPRRFRGDDVVTLNGVRCSGAAHNGCQKACTILWREAWLRKADDNAAALPADPGGGEALRARLKVSLAPNRYYCQASELAKAADPLSRGARARAYFDGFRVGNLNALQVTRGLSIWLAWKIGNKLFGTRPHGNANPTPAEPLNLQQGEWVEVKPIESIIKTLNEKGQNRGLTFTADMRLHCGKRYRVKSRLDRIIVDGTGAERRLKNTVCLEGSICGCDYLGFGMGGCSRCEVTYWREIWLRRASDPSLRPTGNPPAEAAASRSTLD